jgi:geranylgeranyl diphosphate synthase type I
MMISENALSLPQLMQLYLPAVEESLVQAVHRATTGQLDELQRMLAYHMGWEGDGAGPEARGKRIRPLLVLLSCAAAGGDWKTALPAASAVELVHNFSLIHDDIEDNSPLRRGRTTLWKLWGIPQALNAGDAMFAIAHLEILRLDGAIPPLRVIQAVKVLQETCLHLTQGQYLDLSYEQRSDLSIDDYWAMISGKTAALLSACTGLGALVAGMEGERLNHFQEFGRSLGLAFQVQDDILGIWGDAELTGKSAESDLVTGKKSLPVLYGLSKKGRFAQRWLKDGINPQEVVGVADLLNEEGGRYYCEQKSAELTQQAINALEHAQPDRAAKDALLLLANKLLQRQG